MVHSLGMRRGRKVSCRRMCDSLSRFRVSCIARVERPQAGRVSGCSKTCPEPSGVLMLSKKRIRMPMDTTISLALPRGRLISMRPARWRRVTYGRIFVCTKANTENWT